MSKSICAKITSLVNTNRRRPGKTSPDWPIVRWTLDSAIWRERDRDILRQKKHVVADDPRRGSPVHGSEGKICTKQEVMPTRLALLECAES